MPSTTPTPWDQTKPIVYPNPIQEEGKITLLPPLSAGTDLHIEVFTLAFRKVEDSTLQLGSAGENVSWSFTDGQGKTLANGIYYLVLSGGGHHWNLKVLVLR
jgi:hypothetical protein